MSIFGCLFDSFSARPEAALKPEHTVPETTRTRIVMLTAADRRKRVRVSHSPGHALGIATRWLLAFFTALFFLTPAPAVAQKVGVKVIKLTQGSDSITVYMYPVATGPLGFWRAPRNDVGNDGGSHNQWKWDQKTKTVRFYDDIGERDVRGAGHNISFDNSEDMVLTLKGVASFPANLKSGDSGKGEKHDKHSHGIQGDLDWKCTGTEIQDMILK